MPAASYCVAAFQRFIKCPIYPSARGPGLCSLLSFNDLVCSTPPTCARLVFGASRRLGAAARLLVRAAGLAALLVSSAGAQQSTESHTASERPDPIGKTAAVDPSLRDQSPLDQSVGDGLDGLPGIVRVGVPATPGPRIGAALWAGYGLTEAQSDEAGAHHRVSTTATLGGAINRTISGALRLDFRHDVHPADAQGNDSGSTLDLSPIVRASFPLGKSFALAAEGKVGLRGAAATAGLPSPVVEGKLLGSAFSHKGLIVSALLGVRSAQRGPIVREAADLRRGDRVVLGLSEHPAVLVGLGAAQKLGRTDLLFEATADVAVSGNAPPVPRSPLRLDAGIRYRATPTLLLHALVEAAPGARAASTTTAPLVPIEPRIAGLIGISLRLPPPKRPPAPTTPAISEPEPEPEPEPVLAKTAAYVVEVVDTTGHPISDAEVNLERENPDGTWETFRLPLQHLNRYELAGVPVGSARVVVEADLLRPHRELVEVTEKGVNLLRVELRKVGSAGSQLRGLVRSYSGRGLRATITVTPGDHRIECDENGEFELDLPPGGYQVMIEAKGYAPQKRALSVGKEGVTVLNADLQAE